MVLPAKSITRKKKGKKSLTPSLLPPTTYQVSARASPVAPKAAGIPIHIEYCEK
jgi:hypothetical protein